MAQDFVGSNNVNLLQPNGQFGTRNMGGKDHARSRYIYTRLSPIARFLFPKDDDTVLDYLNEDGQSIEPTWYVPIIPMVLVNGSEGIGTGWSSYVPNYNPRDIVANVRRLLNGELMEPMDPWYKGFNGKIEKTRTNKTGAVYTVTGIIEKVNETTLRISELPIRRWTEDYRQFLENMTVSNDKQEAFVKEVRAYGDENSVCFELTLSKENLLLAQQEGLLKKFDLTTTISTSNMHLFDSRGKIKKYDTPEEIIEEFYHVRLEYYEKRKKALLEILKFELLRIENKVKFILGIMKGEIIVGNRKRADLLVDLKNKGFSLKRKIVEAVAADTTDDAEGNDESPEELNRGVRASDYDYLLSMAIETLNPEKVQELCTERDKLNGEVEDMINATPQDLWLKNLAAIEKQLDEQDKIDTQAEDNKEKIKKSMNTAKIDTQAEEAKEKIKKLMNTAGLKASGKNY